jgi:hypothetical protein
LSRDTLAGVVAFFLIYIYTGGGLSIGESSGLLTAFAAVAASIFAIVLTGFTIITSFTDRFFLYAWKEVGEFDNIVTTFQYNLLLPIILILGSVTLMVAYHSVAMMILIAFFVYMLFSLIDLVFLISRYSLQRAELVKQMMDKLAEENPIKQEERLSDRELLEIREKLREIEEEEKEA